MLNLNEIKTFLKQEGVDGWLFYNFHNIDPSSNGILDIPQDKILTRRWFYYIPREKPPCKLVHKIEVDALDHLPGSKEKYSNWRELHTLLKKILTCDQKICMQYSPLGNIPYVSFVDGGTIDLVKSCGVEIVSSANLIQKFEAVWSDKELLSHKRAAKNLKEIVISAFKHIENSIIKQEKITEYDVQKYILDKFAEKNMICNHPPIVAINENSGNPHYETSKTKKMTIKKGDFVLIDLWAKENTVQTVYADITWTAFIGNEIPEKYTKIFTLVKNARDSAVKFIKERFEKGEDVHGFEVDNICRGVIEEAGYGKYFIHRTGHSIGAELHWKGVNIDNFETKDERKIIERVGFSIEPGIYLEDFGIRSELNVYIDGGKAYVSGEPVQEEIYRINVG